MWSLGRRVVASLAVLSAALSGVCAQADAARAEFEAIEKLSRDSMPEGVTVTLGAQWAMERNERLQHMGRSFLYRYPDDPLRWDVVCLLRFAVSFERVLKADGKDVVVIDVGAEQEWKADLDNRMGQLLSSTDASDAARRIALELPPIMSPRRLASIIKFEVQRHPTVPEPNGEKSAVSP